MLKVEGPAAALLATRTVPLLCVTPSESHTEASDVLKLQKRRTHIELIVCGYTSCAGSRAKGRACDLVPSSQIVIKVELGVWDRVKAFPVILCCDDVGPGSCGLVA